MVWSGRWHYPSHARKAAARAERDFLSGRERTEDLLKTWSGVCILHVLGGAVTRGGRVKGSSNCCGIMIMVGMVRIPCGC
jgi:hypothetical protein